GTAVGHVEAWAGERAWAVPVGDDRALSEGILALLTDAPRRHTMGDAAGQWAGQYDADWTARQVEMIYADVMRR
ncbi:MAG: hypothetical protein H0T73_05345, partial [Ardenticatenales bacterium]|nr:hypothetical protein [Ardenticatenales bacterium]